MNKKLLKMVKEEKLFPILRCNDAKSTIDIAKAIIDGGAKVIEINAENPEAYKVIQEISEHATVCAGGIITSQQAQASIDVGAKILSSPIFHINLLKISKDKQIPYIAGTSTANEAYTAWKARIPLIKIFPITPMGGAMYVEDLLRHMPFLNIMPIGSVKLEEVSSYIRAGAASVGIGRGLYEGFSFNEITHRTETILAELKA
ncbi:MAG: bifunctional 4-hydroxy-2-oxoglutarate aldolase/2-dehydro-3-deoxy-phosphogluconate aldolase [Candidatus Gastranaerophilales bacterium]